MKTKASRYHNQDPVYYRYREFVVGLFTLIPLLVIPVIFVVMLFRSDFTKERFELFFTHKLSAQISAGNEVYILSKKVGYVRDVELTHWGHVVVKLAVEEEYRTVIRDDTRIRLRQKNVIMGDWQMELVLGNSAAQMVEDGDTLELIPPLNMAELSQEAIEIADLISEILDTVANGNGVITHLLKSDSTINSRVEETSESIRSALSTLNSVLAETDQLMSSGRNLMDSVVAVRTPIVFDELDEVLIHTDSMLMRADSMFVNIDRFVDASDSIPDEILEAIDILSRDLLETEILLKASQKHWLFRRKVEEVLEEQELE